MIEIQNMAPTKHYAPSDVIVFGMPNHVIVSENV